MKWKKEICQKTILLFRMRELVALYSHKTAAKHVNIVIKLAWTRRVFRIQFFERAKWIFTCGKLTLRSWKFARTTSERTPRRKLQLAFKLTRQLPPNFYIRNTIQISSFESSFWITFKTNRLHFFFLLLRFTIQHHNQRFPRQLQTIANLLQTYSLFQ